jgi:hypothetical protein
MDLTDRTVLDAQASGLACVYCGRSWRRDGSLAPLRGRERPSAAGHAAPAGRWSLANGEASRCDPPCAAAQEAYRVRMVGGPGRD